MRCGMARKKLGAHLDGALPKAFGEGGVLGGPMGSEGPGADKAGPASEHSSANRP